uniref:Uncharacterized protein n=1 Tax=Arundo donax TaxID=35708 RepID=A0A0A9CEE1_ARUDO
MRKKTYAERGENVKGSSHSIRRGKDRWHS